MITAILQSAVILLQIVMVSLGTHLVKVMSPSPEPMSPKLKKLEPSFNQAV